MMQMALHRNSLVPGIAQARPAQACDAAAKMLLYTLVIAVTFLQKTPVNLGATQIFLGFVVIMGASLAGIMSGRLAFHPLRLGFYLLMASGMALTQLIGGHEFSQASVILLLVMHMPYVFKLKDTQADALSFFQNVMAFLAVAGTLQFFLQYLIGAQYAFFADTMLPRSLFMIGYHQLNPLHYGSTIFKSNGVFLLEPSMFSQFLAISIVIEMLYFKRMIMFALYFLGILTSFSGTGLMIIAALVPAYLIQKRQFLAIAALLVFAGLLIALAPLVGLDGYFNRITEFSSTQSSGYARFISMFVTLHDYMIGQADTLLLGVGAGSLKDILPHVNYASFDPSWGKILFEYGFLGALAYFPFMLYVIFANPVSGYLKAALAIQFFFMGEFILTPISHGIILALVAWPSSNRRQALS